MKGFHCRQHLSSVKYLKKDQSQYLVCHQFIEYRLHLRLDRIALLTLKKNILKTHLFLSFCNSVHSLKGQNETFLCSEKLMSKSEQHFNSLVHMHCTSKHK